MEVCLNGTLQKCILQWFLLHKQMEVGLDRAEAMHGNMSKRQEFLWVFHFVCFFLKIILICVPMLKKIVGYRWFGHEFLFRLIHSLSPLETGHILLESRFHLHLSFGTKGSLHLSFQNSRSSLHMFKKNHIIKYLHWKPFHSNRFSSRFIYTAWPKKTKLKKSLFGFK